MILDKYLDYLQESEWFDKVQRNLIDLKHGNDPVIHALKMRELQAKIVASKSLLKKGAIGLGVAGATAGGYQLYKKLKKRSTKKN